MRGRLVSPPSQSDDMQDLWGIKQMAIEDHDATLFTILSAFARARLRHVPVSEPVVWGTVLATVIWLPFLK
ncbi:hypothetical protein SAMN04488092_101376 [Thalassovita taeanensis]|uniref:Uncharacterized protein n=1 Tax=Thalassovita taeanensis TaxID=657014 RepID=A0A1H8ZBJ1_9RHOB|nr:hypothetical protein SAMN04488092_101376 [Thalassovita taeanensis]